MTTLSIYLKCVFPVSLHLANVNQKLRIAVWSFITCFNAFFIFPKLLNGLPMGEDATSHLYKILYSYQNYKATGVVPAWSNLWYAGHPLFLYYPPLSYYLVLAVSLIGFDPVSAYKVVDALFYFIAPIAVYFLAKKLQLNEKGSLAAALLFTISPSVVENYYFFDRYPTTISIPLIAVFIVLLIRVLEDAKLSDVSLLALTSATIILTHHLSAYLLILIVPIFALYFLSRKNLYRASVALILTAIGSFLASAFWLIPFIDALKYQQNNPFANHNLYINYIDIPHLGQVVFILGAIQFLSALIMIGLCFFGDPKDRRRLLVVILLFSLGALYSTFFSVTIGQILIASSLTIALITILKNRLPDPINGGRGISACALLFLVSFWLSLGSNALLIQILPFWQKLDNMRFFLYASIPQAVLAGKYLTGALEKGALPISRAHNIKIGRNVLAAFICVSAIVSFSFGAVSTGLNRATPNTDIPRDLVEYFKTNPKEGRILPIECPKWIYVLPVYTDKPIIDGWFPQSKILKPLLAINDYRINDLMDYPLDTRIEIWRKLISNYIQLDIKWIMIGNASLNYLAEENPIFGLVFASGQIRIYEADKNLSFIETNPQTAASNISVTQPKPDEIQIIVKKLNENTTITIKEAYMPYWTLSSSNNTTIKLYADPIGYITLGVPPTSNTRITLNFSYQNEDSLNLVSFITFITLLIIPMIDEARKALNKKNDRRMLRTNLLKTV